MIPQRSTPRCSGGVSRREDRGARYLEAVAQIGLSSYGLGTPDGRLSGPRAGEARGCTPTTCESGWPGPIHVRFLFGEDDKLSADSRPRPAS